MSTGTLAPDPATATLTTRVQYSSGQWSTTFSHPNGRRSVLYTGTDPLRAFSLATDPSTRRATLSNLEGSAHSTPDHHDVPVRKVF